MNMKQLLELLDEQSKVVVVDEGGEVKGVFLSWEQYSALSGVTSTSVKPTKTVDVVEQVNREITKAQLEEPASVVPASEASVSPTSDAIPNNFSAPMHINSAISQRAQELFKSMPFGRIPEPDIDLRSEVIDPMFNFSNSDNTEDEEIKTSFEDV